MTDLLILFLASFLIWLLFFGLLVLWIIDGRVKREVALHAFIGGASAWGIAQLLKAIFRTSRPFVFNGGPILSLSEPTDGSFPSGHASAAFALAVTIWLHDKRLGAAFLVIALVIGAARIWANVHFPIDIVGGAVLGTVVAIAFEKLHVYKLISRSK